MGPDNGRPFFFVLVLFAKVRNKSPRVEGLAVIFLQRFGGWLRGTVEADLTRSRLCPIDGGVPGMRVSRALGTGLVWRHFWWSGNPPPPPRVGEGPIESAKVGEVAKNQNVGCSTD